MAGTLRSAQRCIGHGSCRSILPPQQRQVYLTRLHNKPSVTSRPIANRFYVQSLTSREPAHTRTHTSAAASHTYHVETEQSLAVPRHEHLDIPKIVAVCTTCFALCAFVSAAFPASTPNFAALSLAAGEAVAGAHVATAKSAWAGLAAGFLHTLCGPDHLAALTPLTIGRPRSSATLLGALWGFGHSTGQLILGLFFVLLKERFNNFLPALSKWAGVIVGLTLLAIGFLGIYETLFEGGDHGDHAVDLALAGADGAVMSATAQSAKFGLATYATGIVYGLQPDALFVVIPALALPTKLAAIAYCTMFVVGTVTAMGGYTLLIGTTSQALIKQKPWLQSHLSSIASGVAIVVGALILAAGLGIAVPFFG